jgi:hypothetical protein
MPSFKDSSSAMRSSPQVMFSLTMRAMSWRISLGSAGRPPLAPEQNLGSQGRPGTDDRPYELGALDELGALAKQFCERSPAGAKLWPSSKAGREHCSSDWHTRLRMTRLF